MTISKVATKQDIRELELNLMIKIGVMLAVAIGILVTLQKLA